MRLPRWIFYSLAVMPFVINAQQDTVRKEMDGDTGSSGQVLVEKLPQFPGGEEALMKFLSDSIHYPRKARESGITGRVIVRFVVEKDGTVTNVSVSESAHPLLDSAAVEAVRKMPAWGCPENREGKL